MAWYLTGSSVRSCEGSEAIWRSSHRPNTIAPATGIYRCCGCRREIAFSKGNAFPPENHHHHNAGQGEIAWRLLVWANVDGS